MAQAFAYGCFIQMPDADAEEGEEKMEPGSRHHAEEGEGNRKAIIGQILQDIFDGTLYETINIQFFPKPKPRPGYRVPTPNCHFKLSMICSQTSLEPRGIRLFLVADDLSIKLCDFAGSGIGNMPPVVTEEDRYRKSPDSPRSFQTDLFALGCLIFEIMVGSRPYEEINDADWEMIAENYERGIFPPVAGVKYGEIIHMCEGWVCFILTR
ncbi:hypothetical protein P175DRAFT_0534245 [Aspergillus ochraceoroseus IBT 24754]|uniref:Protein kinase domain-containing protein n=1 Tax=Aspergillus ochraceoroseus IBT 24754 TaxID=1392256 RepID=A0A2T5LQF5_9EURO|nr:uncharacterized protein P175DRAFT_0534245 [Aspergillus ochraceoroseus IBT 24754]PTU18507.1 hypothetical protein P175DRAFT_0534245 [Aspergillus ochraceoroseus IBT 24754]